MGGLVMLLALVTPTLIYIGYPLLCFGMGSLIWWLLRKKATFLAPLLGLLVFSSLMFIPFADYFPQRQRIDNLCAAEGGFKIFKTIQEVNGVHGLSNAIDFGYEFGEIYAGKRPEGVFSPEDKTQPLIRYFRAPQGYNGGRFLEVKADTPTTYGLRTSRDYLGNMIYRVTDEIYIVDSNETLGQVTFFYSVTKPYHEIGFSWNILRSWMEMRCREVDDKNFTLILTRELLKKTLVPKPAQ